MRLDGFGIFVDDMAVMVRFYRDVLGFGIKEDENTSNVFLEKDGTLFLLYRKSDFEPFSSGMHTILYLKESGGTPCRCGLNAGLARRRKGWIIWNGS